MPANLWQELFQNAIMVFLKSQQLGKFGNEKSCKELKKYFSVNIKMLLKSLTSIIYHLMFGQEWQIPFVSNNYKKH